MYSVQLSTVRKGFDPANDFCWIIPVATPLDSSGENVLLSMRKGELHKPGRWDIFSQPYQMLSHDGGKSWTNPVPEKGLGNIIDGEWEYVFNGNPKLHRKTGKCLSIGTHIGYKNGKLGFARELLYSVLDIDNSIWSKPLKLAGLSFTAIAAHNGGMQRVELSNGDILLPVYGKNTKEDKYFSMIVKCGFDGNQLQVKEWGQVIELNIKRGFCEPSLIYFQGLYYLTLRNDLAGYIAVGKDGLNFSTPKKWLFDDGRDLGNYNTQQHWVVHDDKLFLVYTRKDVDNEHMAIVRHRAPLLMAEVNPQTLCIIKETERIIIPERGAKLGNFDVVEINENETWIVVAEWMEERPELVSREYGSDNSVFVATIIWNN
jgi:hypothetical protein